MSWETAVAATSPDLWWKFNEPFDDSDLFTGTTATLADSVGAEDARVRILPPGGSPEGYAAQLGYVGLAQGGSGTSLRLFENLPPALDTAPPDIRRISSDVDFDLDNGSVAISYQYQGIDVPYLGTTYELGTTMRLMRYITDALQVMTSGQIHFRGTAVPYNSARMKNGKPHLIIYTWRGPDDSPPGTFGREWLYIDGDLIYDTGETTDSFDYEGGSDIVAGPLPGGYQDYLLWETRLTSAQVLTLYSAWSDGQPVAVTADALLVQEQQDVTIESEWGQVGDLSEHGQEQTLTVFGRRTAPYYGQVELTQSQELHTFDLPASEDTEGQVYSGNTSVVNGSPEISAPDVLSDGDLTTYVDLPSNTYTVGVNLPPIPMTNNRLTVSVLGMLFGTTPGFTASAGVQVFRTGFVLTKFYEWSAHLSWQTETFILDTAFMDAVIAGDAEIWISGTTNHLRAYEVRVTVELDDLTPPDLEGPPPPNPTPVQTADQVFDLTKRRPL